MTHVGIIGGGASGLMAAIQAARAGAKVTLLEHNEKVGKKILATGNGRCNLTNGYQDPSCYRGEDPAFSWSVIQQFPMEETLAFFSGLGIYTRDRKGWIYPYSDQAASVAQVLEMEARYRKVKIKTREEVTAVEKTDSGWEIRTSTWQYPCEKVIICCGGSASQVEGSGTGGYLLARQLGHTVLEPMPALCGLRGQKASCCGKWAGCRMEAVVQLEIDGQYICEDHGEVMFTEYGISGIPVFQISRFAVRAARSGKKVVCHLDLFPGVSKEDLQKLLEERQRNCPYKTLQEQLVGLIPQKMIAVLAPKGTVPEAVAANMKDWPVVIRDAYALSHAQVCSGGVLTGELTEQMESRRHPGLYFAGEVVDVDGPCGGYNLQWAWSSGAVAGRAAAGGKL